jgi:hypothetical protein
MGDDRDHGEPALRRGRHQPVLGGPAAPADRGAGPAADEPGAARSWVLARPAAPSAGDGPDWRGVRRLPALLLRRHPAPRRGRRGDDQYLQRADLHGRARRPVLAGAPRSRHDPRPRRRHRRHGPPGGRGPAGLRPRPLERRGPGAGRRPLLQPGRPRRQDRRALLPPAPADHGGLHPGGAAAAAPRPRRRPRPQLPARGLGAAALPRARPDSPCLRPLPAGPRHGARHRGRHGHPAGAPWLHHTGRAAARRAPGAHRPRRRGPASGQHGPALPQAGQREQGTGHRAAPGHGERGGPREQRTVSLKR